MFQFRKGLWYNDKVKSRMGKSWIARILFLGNIFLCFGFLFVGSVSALSYQQDIGVNFTFNPVLSLTLSSNDIHIVNLAPGTASDSNVINVNVVTNSVGGYTLNATVGNSTTYNTRNLLHTNSNISDNFSSIAYSSTPTITTNTNLSNDTWGFSFSVDNGTNWSNYNGLPLYSDTVNIATLKHTNGPVSSASGDDIKFKIAAKASETKPSGDYSNVINFTLVAAPAPISLLDAYAAAGKQQFNGYYKMQDMSSNICDLVEAVDEQLQVIDIRDGKTYWIAKLRDGKCWMTQNLDLDLDTNKTLTHADTDLGWGSVIDATATWTPDTSTDKPIEEVHIWAYDVPSKHVEYTQYPRSIDPGDSYWSGNLISNSAKTEWINYYNNSDCVDGDYDDCLSYVSGRGWHTSNPFTYMNSGASTGDSHYHLGNYYNAPAALASNYLGLVSTQYPDSPIAHSFDTSICPAGWTLPDGTVNNNDFRGLLNSYDVDISTQEGSRALTLAPFYFNVAGAITSEFHDTNEGMSATGVYLSNTVWDNLYQNEFNYNHPSGFTLVIDEDVTPHSFFGFANATSVQDSKEDAYGIYDYGVSVRCIAR